MAQVATTERTRVRPPERKPRGRLVGITLPADEYVTLRDVARAQDRSISWVARRFIRAGLARIVQEAS